MTTPTETPICFKLIPEGADGRRDPSLPITAEAIQRGEREGFLTLARIAQSLGHFGTCGTCTAGKADVLPGPGVPEGGTVLAQANEPLLLPRSCILLQWAPGTPAPPDQPPQT